MDNPTTNNPTNGVRYAKTRVLTPVESDFGGDSLCYNLIVRKGACPRLPALSVSGAFC